jgi:hypothetical protein
MRHSVINSDPPARERLAGLISASDEAGGRLEEGGAVRPVGGLSQATTSLHPVRCQTLSSS